jgi:hypothetical protein
VQIVGWDRADYEPLEDRLEQPGRDAHAEHELARRMDGRHVRAEAIDPSGNLAVAVRGTDRDDLLTLLADDLVRLVAGTQTVQGDAGLDTLALGTSGVTLDLTRVADSALTGIERFALGRNTLVLTVADVRALGGSELTVNGEAGGAVRLLGSGWSSTGEVTEGGVVYAVYENDGTRVRAQAGLTITPNATPLASADDDGSRRLAIGGDPHPGPGDAPPPAGEPSRPTPMSLTTTLDPSAANARACARPMPPPAPVTITTRPSSNPISLLSPCWLSPCWRPC